MGLVESSGLEACQFSSHGTDSAPFYEENLHITPTKSDSDFQYL